MLLKGSCHCGSVRFQVEAPQPYPFCRCYCSICRKTAGGGGYAINLGALAATLKVEGADNTSIYHAVIDGEPSSAERHFCHLCASALWLFDPSWPELVHPFASAVDTPLPTPPERTHMLLDSKAEWVEVENRDADKCFAAYPDETLAEWHQRVVGKSQ